MSKRMVGVFAALMLAMTGIIVRLGQLVGQNGISAVAHRQAGITVTVETQRGSIYDRNLHPLVGTQPEYRVCVAPYTTDISTVLTGLDKERQQALISRLRSGKPAVQTVPGLLPSQAGILQFICRSRYGDRVPAPHLIGYRDSEGKGVTGIEAAFEERLSAAAGTLEVTYAVDGTGLPLRGVEPTVTDTTQNSRDGVVLTLDADIQRVAENVAAQMLKKGVILVMKPETGELLAGISRPDYQPATLAQQLSQEDAPLLNRILSNYNCGSVFKIISAAAALESGVLPETVFTCTGSVTVGDTVFYCHNKLGHGSITMQEAFAESCNCYFIQLIQRVGGTALRRMAVACDYDQAIPLAGTMKTARASLPTVAELVSPAELANLSFGQGALLATPVHVAQMLTAVLGDGTLHRASLLRGYVEQGAFREEKAVPPTRLVFSAQTAATLRRFMEATVQSGSGQKACPDRGGAGGKTGTAETGWVNEGSDVVQSWFAGYYPAENPRYIIVVLAEDKNNTATVAAPVFRKLCNALADME